ncbi:recombinase family protein [Sinomonas atrocyanea]|jgi:hypothetical protein|uniref:recombinase family protein n=1 Tax=Sinomonas atrocyanea TaxID=37927 RepID=UPI0027836FB2|nr:recombinase family protein [Sinomonas atrocyanea]MDQ0261403.1 hypothetical protein [Sinomonas atrocyanea]MDR6623542.1 hypothetical protein [Sinomonas atrocyanea]
MVTKLDRLGRSLENLIEVSKQLEAKGVDLVVLDQGIDTSTPSEQPDALSRSSWPSHPTAFWTRPPRVGASLRKGGAAAAPR